MFARIKFWMKKRRIKKLLKAMAKERKKAASEPPKRTLCPQCGYYCLGNTIFCLPPLKNECMESNI